MPLADTCIPAFVAEAAPAVAELNTGQGGIISRMAEVGLAQARTLGSQEGAPLLTITHVGRTEDGRVVEVTRHVLSEGWTLRYGVPLG